MRNENLTVHPCSSEEFSQHRAATVAAMTAMLTAYLEATGQENMDECKESLEALLTEWWDARNLSIPDQCVSS